MRHFLPPGSVAALAFGMGKTAPKRGLIAATGGAQRMAAGPFGAAGGAVALAAVAVAANEYGRAATGAQIASSGRFHGS